MLFWAPMKPTWRTRLRAKVVQRNGLLRYIENTSRPHLLRAPAYKTLLAKKRDSYPTPYVFFCCRIRYDWRGLATNMDKYRRMVTEAVARRLTQSA